MSIKVIGVGARREVAQHMVESGIEGAELFL